MFLMTEKYVLCARIHKDWGKSLYFEAYFIMHISQHTNELKK